MQTYHCYCSNQSHKPISYYSFLLATERSRLCRPEQIVGQQRDIYFCTLQKYKLFLCKKPSVADEVCDMAFYGSDEIRQDNN